MKCLFTIHGGEYLVGEYIERHFKRVNLWIPARDTGIDLLITDRQNRRSLSMQVKYSKDFLPAMTNRGPRLQGQLRACTWWTINEEKLHASRADLWVFVLPGFVGHTQDFLIVPPKQLASRLRRIHGRHKIIQSYFWVTERDRCWEARGLRRGDEDKIGDDNFHDPHRDFTDWLNNWRPVEELNR